MRPVATYMYSHPGILLIAGRGYTMECLSSLHLLANGSGGWSTWSSIQQPQYFTVKISVKVPPQEKKDMAVCQRV